jgi:hypothetical protein
VNQINGLYDYKSVYELAALYLERIARSLGAELLAVGAGVRQPGPLPHVVPATTIMADLSKMRRAIDYTGHLERVAMAQLSMISSVADRKADIADNFKSWQGVPILSDFFKKWEEADYSTSSVMRFICSGLLQYSFFEALRRQIMYDLSIPAHRDAAMSNLGNMQHVIFRDDPGGLIPAYVQQVQSGKRAISDPVSNEVLNFLKTAVPMDFDTSPNLEWRYVIRKGVVWRIQEASADYLAQNEEEQEVLAILSAKHALPF